MAKVYKQEEIQLVTEVSKKLYEKYGNDFPAWVEKYIDFGGLSYGGLTPQQIEMWEMIKENKRACIGAGGGIGKTAFASLLIQWFLITHPYSVVPTTAPSSKQLRDILWAQISFWLKRNKLRSFYELTTNRLRIIGHDEWYAVPRTVPKDGKDINDTLAGFHAEHLLIVVDEASGVPDPVFTALEGAMTNENAYILLISNPVSTGGYFYDTITDREGKGKDYAVKFFSSLESPIVSKEYEQRIINRYGKNSAMYKAKVLGLPITISDTVIVPPDVFDKVVSEQKERPDNSVKVVIGIDRGSTTDKTVICVREGYAITHWFDDIYEKDTDILTEVMQLIDNWYVGRDVTIVVDAIGIGNGLYQKFQEETPYEVIGFKGSEKAFNNLKFKNKRTETYFRLKEEFPKLHFPVEPPKRLKKELANLLIQYDEPIQLEPKDKFKKRLGFSPDYADALMMSLYVDTYMGQIKNTYVPKGVGRSLIDKHRRRNGHNAKYGKFGKFRLPTKL